MFKKYLQKKPVRYVLVGGLSYIIELVVILLLLQAADLHRTFATALSFWFSILTSFYLQKFLVFGDKNNDLKNITMQGTLFFALVAFNYIFTLLVVSFFPEEYIFFSRTLALAVVTIWNFFIYKRIVFSSGHDAKGGRSLAQVIVGVKAFIKRYTVPFIALSLPVAIFNAHYLLGGNRIIDGDFDYYAQMYEAFRITVLDFGQFPSWNPWISGGMPLFANPQFGLFSIQSLLVLMFGTIYGLKLAYFIYALTGFWGMFFLCRKRFGADKFRSAMLGYIWVFCGFFVGHNISHFTFSSFYLMPLILLCLYYWRRKWSWAMLGLVMSVIVLSSLHYAFLIISMSAVIFLAHSAIVRFLGGERDRRAYFNFMLFASKAGLLMMLLSGYRILTTYLFVKSNARPTAIFGEASPGLIVNLKALFLPVVSILPAPKTQYGWGEYSAYMGIGVSIVIILMLGFATWRLIGGIRKRQLSFLNKQAKLILPLVLLALVAFSISLGDFGLFSPFQGLRMLPGFSETRVSSRWLIVVVFSILLLIASVKSKKRIVNSLLLFSVLELMVFFGPLSQFGHDGSYLPEAKFSPVFSQFDNNRMHLGLEQYADRSYYYSTSRNIGNIYADDSIINTLNNVLATSRCGENVNPSCDLVLSDNADISYWSPNKLVLRRTSVGEINLNMNRDGGWSVNGNYIFMDRANLDPSLKFTIPDDGANNYEIIYAPKLSPEWLRLKLN